jgi:hypothetical protein
MPMLAYRRGPTFGIVFPTTGERSTAKTPAGARTNPAHSEVYPICVCSHSGSSSVIPKKRAKPKDSVAIPIVKLRLARSVRSTMGCSSVSSHTRKKTNPIAAATPSPTMKGEPNQSSSFPLSSRIWSDPTQITRSAMPTKSMGTECVGVSWSDRSSQVPNAAKSPTGTLMRKIHDQW